MKSVILAGGFGKRLKPLTDTIPKSLIDVDGKPILVRQLEWLRKHDIVEIILCIGHLKEKIVKYMGDGKQFGVTIDYVIEEKPLGTGGALLNAKHHLINEDHFIVLNGDVITTLNPKELIKKIDTNYGILSLVPLRSPYGIVNVDQNMQIKNFTEKPLLRSHLINAGVYCLKPNIFNYLQNKTNIESVGFPEIAKENKLAAVQFNKCFWKSIDGFKDIEEAEKGIKNISAEK